MTGPLIRRRGSEAAATPVPEAPLAASKDEITLPFLRNKVKINRNTLDVVVEEQPELFRQAAEGHVRAVSLRDEAKDHLLRMDAKLALDLRDGKFKDQKVTEGRINDEVLQDKDHISAYEDFARKKQEADEWSAIREAYEMRGKMLRELVGLYATGYFGNTTGGSTRDTYLNERSVGAREQLHKDRQSRQQT